MRTRIIAILSLFFFIGMIDVHGEKVYPPVDILIDAGHGGVDSGTSYGEIEEKEINLSVGKRLYEQLSQSGYHVVLNRFGDYALSDDNHWLLDPSRHRRDLAQREHLANALSPKILISLHVNWSNKPLEHGPQVFFQKNHRSLVLANFIQQALNELYNTSFPPLRGENFYMLNHTKGPAVLVEMGFLSNPKDRKHLTDPKHQEQIASAIKQAIDNYFMVF